MHNLKLSDERGNIMDYLFNGKEHEAFFNEMVFKTKKDSYHKALFYTLGILEETRDNITSLYDFKRNEIETTGLNKAWQTDTSIKLCRLAFNLFNGYYGPRTKADNYADFTPYNLFDCGYILYMLEAIKIRYKSYANQSGDKWLEIIEAL